MKKIILTGIAALCFATMTLAQAPPQGVNYQAVAYDTKSSEIPGTDVSSLPIANQTIKVRFTIIKDQANGTEIYSEEHTTETDENGLFDLIIGKGFQLSNDDFPSIDWGTGLHFLKVDLDVSGSYNTMGTQQIWSVPYALYSEKSGNGVEQIVNAGGDLSITLENGDTYTVPLSGAQGPQGPQGPAGNDGATGPQGPQGPQGTPGVRINWLGDFTTAPTAPHNNDGYYHSTDGISYVWNGSSWEIVAQDGNDGATGATGPAGATGPQGPQGPQGTPGVSINWLGDVTTAPTSPNNNDGSYNSTDGISYDWNGSSWEIIARDGNDGATGPVSATGPQGPQGNPGPQGPAGTNGADGINMEWLGDFSSAPGSPTLNQAYYNTTDGESYIWDGAAWQTVARDGTGGSTGPHNTLDEAYNEGGAGAGRTITANNGAVEINHTSTTNGNKAMIVNTTQTGSFGIDATNSGTGVAIRAISTNVGNTFPALQVESNSSDPQNSALIGQNSGAGYGITGQILASATGTAAVYGNNLRTTGGYGVEGIGFNGVVGTSNYPLGFGVYGINTATTGDAVGTYGNGVTGVYGETVIGEGYGVFGSNSGTTGLGIGTVGLGFIGVYGETNDLATGYAGYFSGNVSVDGDITADAFVNTSDRRLKSNIIPIENALDKIMELKPKHYTIKTKSVPNLKDGKVVIKERQEYGVIAQELELIFPGMISEKAFFKAAGDDTLYKGVNYVQLIPVLIEAMKELKEEVDTNKSEIEILKQEIEALKNK
ncbi:hypothetical protein CW751_11780 [Brumimicrobium salinarum]|uniref:Peptidase S74 domain-containing protein n=1 Tax=Brumimicrobium salinarum TaxID=2058658 RepID=A0A2I0R0C3_9FLAO|nr:tail fiber domain-containing protein [Brumimicrobium salinarum]PKR80041.1 hypothetical protein CW751_11780 [Brumimicrobium salinarum]